jgi:asparagine synthase (glutamine-hydrolysing)
VASTHIQSSLGPAGAPEEWCRTTLQLPLRPNIQCTDTPINRLPALEGAKAILTGEGGDDWLAGTHSHWPDLVAHGRWGRLAGETFGARPDLPPLANLKAIVSEGVLPLILRERRERLWRFNLAFSYEVPAWVRPQWAD